MNKKFINGWLGITLPLYIILIIYSLLVIYVDAVNHLYSFVVFISFVFCYYKYASKIYKNYLKNACHNKQDYKKMVKESKRRHILC